MIKKFAVALFLVAAAGACSCGEDEPTNQLSSAIRVAPNSLAFGAVTIGTTSEPQTFTVSNPGSAVLHVDVASDEELFVPSPASASIPPGGSVGFAVTFSPVALDEVKGRVTVASNAGTLEVALSGSGIEPTIVVTPKDGLDFGDVVRNRPDTPSDNTVARGAKLKFAIANMGSDVLEVLDVAIIDDAGGAYSARADQLSGVVGRYAKAERREAEVDFDPAVLGTLDGAIRITTNAPTAPEITLPLRGRGVAPIMTVCTRFDDQPEEATLCTPELPEQVTPATFPGWDFGNFADLEGRGGVLTISNTGNVPLELSTFTFVPSTPDVRFWRDEARTEALSFAGFKPIVCPADVSNDRCTHTGKLTVWVDYRARGSVCCRDGVQECIDLAPGGDCTQAANADRGQLNIASNDPVWRSVTLIGEGRSNIAVAQVERQVSGQLFAGDTLRLQITNAGGAPLVVDGVFFADPDATGCAGGEPCSCVDAPTPVCGAFALDPFADFPFTLQPDQAQNVFVDYFDTELGPRAIDLWWETSAPITPRVHTSIVVQGLGERPSN